MAESVKSKIEQESAEKQKKAKKGSIVIKKKKGGHAAAHGGSWKVAYADFVTAMMAFFLLMWLLNMTSQDQKEKLAAYFQDFDVFAKEVKVDGTGKQQLSISNSSKLGVPDVRLSKSEKLRYSMVMRIKEFIAQDSELKNSADAIADSKGVVFYVDADVMFQQGTVALKPHAAAVLDHVIAVLKDFNFDMVVRGHTDDQDAVSGPFPSNWELSAARAAAGLRYVLKNGGIPATRLRAMGYADSRPLVPNNSVENRAKNRRIEFYYHRPDEQSW
jgi:chemotaxis protein MotB